MSDSELNENEAIPPSPTIQTVTEETGVDSTTQDEPPKVDSCSQLDDGDQSVSTNNSEGGGSDNLVDLPVTETHPLVPSTTDDNDDVDSCNKLPVDTPPPPASPSLPGTGTFRTQTEDGVFFSGINYLGSSTVDAPVSETEANRKMEILKTQAGGQPVPIILQIPPNNTGNIMLKDPTNNQILTAFPIRHVLFCARGDLTTKFSDCLALNVIHKRSGVYHCHVFQCQIHDACEKVFYAIGKAFKQKNSIDEGSSQLQYELDVLVEIHEEDPKGNYHTVPIDKDCFRLRPHTKKKVIFTVMQSVTLSKALPFERCFGLLMAVGKDVKRNEMNLLDNMNTTNSGNGDATSFIVSGYWDTDLPYLTQLNEEPPKHIKAHYLTIAADLVAEGIVEPIRFTRIVKAKVTKSDSLGSLISTLTKRKLPMETFLLTLDKKPQSSPDKGVQFVIRSLKSTQSESVSPSREQQSGAEEKSNIDEVSSTSSLPLLKKEGTAQHVDSDDIDDDGDIIISGWGDDEIDLRDDLLQKWSDMLEKWDGRDKWEPFGLKPRSKHLSSLVRCGIPGPLRCQIWQMLSGADNDPQLLEAYRLLVTKDSPNENVITWDIKRTFVGHEYFQDGVGGREALYKISKAYSIYDQEVGYCQGFSFMAAVLLLQKIPEEQAFSVLVKIMFNYGHRNVFRSNFKELHLMFYQLDRLVEENLHELHDHFNSKSIETHMYASQWFLTIFTAKFPLNLTYQIMDMYLCEGVPIVFQVALALLKGTQHDLLQLDFEGILNYFRATLPKKFATEEEVKGLFSVVKSYQKVNLKKLKKLEKDYQTHLEHMAQLEDPVARLERENKQLQEAALRLQRENDDLAEELVGSKISLRAEMDKLEERIDTLSKEARASKTSLAAANLLIKEQAEELQQAKDTYQKAMLQLAEERQQYDAAITEYKQLFQQLDEGHEKQKEDLSQELLEVKAQLGATAIATPNNGEHKVSLTSEQRLRQLELELAQTKLALVEAQCKNQELERNVELKTAQTTQQPKTQKPSWLSNLSRFNN